MKPIGVDLPIRRGDQGFFKQTFTTTDAIKVNIKNLLLTNNGERPLNPSFGNDLNKVVFESNDNITKELIRERITNTINRYIPSVEIKNIKFDNDLNENYINFSIDFSLKQYPNFIDTISMKVQNG